PIGQTPQTGTALAVGATDAVVDDLDEESAVGATQLDARPRRPRVLLDVGEALGHDVVRRDLDRLGKARLCLDLEPDRYGSTRRDLLQRDRKPVPRQHCWVKPAGDSTQLLERHCDLALRSLQSPPGRG